MMMMVENSMNVHSHATCTTTSTEEDDGQQEISTCGVSSMSSPHVSNNSSSSYSSSTNSEEEDQTNTRSTCRRITKQHKSSNQSPSKKKKRSLIGEIVMNQSQPMVGQLISQHQQQAIVFENFEGRKSSAATTNGISHIPGTFSFSHKVENSQLSNNEQPAAKSNMCEVILSNWKSRSDTRQWIKKCIGPQDKKKKVKKDHQWFQSSNSQLSNSPPFCQPSPTVVFNNQSSPIITSKFDRKPSSNSISTTNVWSDSYIHTTCLIPGQRKVAKSTTPVMASPQQLQSISTQSVSYPTVSHQHYQQQQYSNQYENVSSSNIGNNPWLNDITSTSNVLSDVSDKQFALPSFREFVSTLGL
ncbi:predicted protein [Naegleria gruberi]|uniref:Predicted protein n=1 Tax=Naegleria gruberi TaxID=5762 RepID=D2VLH3_NAEGR|nr:uncharacterized protein NAEGRDRAFT_50538 [Naegleria gruberi]EFC42313.1 predicted protein [Naegleria gruberi]|eukprot:XP_002675057.1 predicted protein [Naegleria gruberi strain NEG-M]